MTAQPILILTQAYPSQGNPYQMAFVHARVKQYLVMGQPVKVLSFAAKQDYRFEGVEVVTLQSAEQSGLFKAATVVSHAPNLRNHFRVIFKQRNNIAKLVFVFHGHEVMHLPREYPKPYRWNKAAIRRRRIYRIYDPAKLFLFKKLLNFLVKRVDTRLIFVSQYMKSIFEKNIFDCKAIKNAVINNPISAPFVNARHAKGPSGKRLSALCIRPLDDSKYGVDLVLDLARANPDIDFDIFGKGNLSQVMQYGINVTFDDRFFVQSDIPTLLNGYDFGVLPTRWDSQGVMAAEFAKIGIPLITSDIPIMREMLGGFTNVCFLPNDRFETRIDAALIDELKYQPSPQTDRLFDLETIAQRELAFINGN
ncbi:MAG: glycosyltransferase [Rhodobacteraceae bacterium]|nr:glycosyltransferase [Paracoccaceae bacterium]